MGEVKSSYVYISGNPTGVSPISKPTFDVINNVFYNMKGVSGDSSNSIHKIFLGSTGAQNAASDNYYASYPSILSYGVGLRGGTYYRTSSSFNQNPSYLYKRSVFIPNSSLS